MSSFDTTCKAFKCNTVYGLPSHVFSCASVRLTCCSLNIFYVYFQSEGDDDTKQVKANTQQNEQANDDEAIEVSLCSFVLL